MGVALINCHAVISRIYIYIPSIYIYTQIHSACTYTSARALLNASHVQTEKLAHMLLYPVRVLNNCSFSNHNKREVETDNVTSVVIMEWTAYNSDTANRCENMISTTTKLTQTVIYDWLLYNAFSLRRQQWWGIETHGEVAIACTRLKISDC